MKFSRLLLFALVLPLAALAADRTLKVDKTRSFVDVDGKSTLRDFSGRLDTYDARLMVDDAGKIKGATLAFKFTDLKTGDKGRDADMIKWLGGGTPEGRFELGILALAPDGQGQVTGKLTFHGQTQLVEFPVNVLRADDTYTITGETVVNYTNWGLKIIRKLGLAKVDPEVKIRFKFIATPPEPLPGN
ncbi:MAG: YceI family protein [Opitutae bacterium]|nr:YceI family protein [Opitutae bacterium]